MKNQTAEDYILAIESRYCHKEICMQALLHKAYCQLKVDYDGRDIVDNPTLINVIDKYLKDK